VCDYLEPVQDEELILDEVGNSEERDKYVEEELEGEDVEFGEEIQSEVKTV
jgi:hypothetical protein